MSKSGKNHSKTPILDQFFYPKSAFTGMNFWQVPVGIHGPQKFTPSSFEDRDEKKEVHFSMFFLPRGPPFFSRVIPYPLEFSKNAKKRKKVSKKGSKKSPKIVSLFWPLDFNFA